MHSQNPNNGNASTPRTSTDKNINIKSLWRNMKYRKNLHNYDIGSGSSKLWNIFELIAIAIGCSLGIGVYVLIGHIAHEQTGPSALVAFVFAGFIGFFGALCFIEFKVQYPSKQGSTVNFIYSSLGEFMAFIVGWNLILEYILATACVSRAFTTYLDTLTGNTLGNKFIEIAPLSWDGVFATHFDFVGFAIPIIIAVALSLGLKRYGFIMTAVTLINIGFIVFIVILGIIKADRSYWHIQYDAIQVTLANITNSSIGTGGFIPFTLTEMFSAVSVCVFVFIGFDSLSSTINMKTVVQSHKNIPRAYYLSFIAIFILYMIVASIFTLMWPYNMHMSDAWLPYVMNHFGWEYARWIVSIAAIISLITSGFIFMHSILPIISIMSEDGLLYDFLSQRKIWPRTPIWGIIIAGCLSGLFAGLFNVNQIVKMLALGTLLMFTALAVGIIIKRYSYEFPMCSNKQFTSSFGSIIVEAFNCTRKTVPSTLTPVIVVWLTILFLVMTLMFSLMWSIMHYDIMVGQTYALVLTVLFLVIMLLSLFFISLQPIVNYEKENFQIPFVPFIPGFAIFLNIYFITLVNVACWIKFGIWMTLGIIVYSTSNYKFRERGIRNPSFPRKYNEDQQNKNGMIKTEENLNSFQSDTISTTNENEKIEQFSNSMSDAEKIIGTNNLTNQNLSANVSIFIPLKIEESNQKKEPQNEDGSSSVKSYDEINLISEVQDNLEEKKERNGSTYFIENDKNEKSNRSSPNDERRSSALAFFDNLIKDDDKSPEPNQGSISTSAIVHSDSSESEIPIPPPQPVGEKPKTSKAKVVPILYDNEFDSDDDDTKNFKSEDFMRKLTIIYKEKTQNPNHSSTKSKSKTILVKTSDRNNEHDERPMMKHSKSESNLKQAVLNESIVYDTASSSYQPSIGVSVIPKPPIFNQDLYDSMGVSPIVCKNYEDQQEKSGQTNDPTTIPSPPPFNQNLYDAISDKKLNEDSQNSNIPLPPVFNEELFESIGKLATVNNLKTEPLKTIETQAPKLDFTNKVSDQKQTDTVQETNNLLASNENIASSSSIVSSIPVAPVFNPILFTSIEKKTENSIASENQNDIIVKSNNPSVQLISKQSQPEQTIPHTSLTLPSTNIVIDKINFNKELNLSTVSTNKATDEKEDEEKEKDDDDDDSKMDRQTMIQKLELIYSRGPPGNPLYPIPKPSIAIEPTIKEKTIEQPQSSFKSSTPTLTPTKSSISKQEMQDIKIDAEYKKKENDSLTKLQKKRFSDVIKLIREEGEIKPSVIRSGSMKKIDNYETARDKLRPVNATVPPT